MQTSDFSFPAGASTVLIGPNGSGKSTLLGAIAGIHPVASGSLQVLGTDPRTIKRRIAFVPQATKVNDSLPVTVREVVSMGRFSTLGLIGRARAGDRRSVDEAMDRLGIVGLAGRHLGELSGGQRQRVFVAQGLVQDRDLLLMDEPKAALDIASAAMIEQVIAEERAANRTVVTTTHDLVDADRADHVVILSGRVVAEGAPDEVLTADVLSQAYHTQLIDVDGRIVFDDPAHGAVGSRHVHADRGSSTHPHD